jgi:hypothetical protein
VLGSDLNARVNWAFNVLYQSNPRLGIYTGIDFTHRSNGGMVQPDQGINVIGPKVAVRYDFVSNPPRHAAIIPQPFHPAWEVVTGLTGGVKSVVEQTHPMLRESFGAADATAAVQRHFYRFGKAAFGADLRYDGSTGVALNPADARWRADFNQRWTLGTYGGYEHVIGRFGALVQVGYVVARTLEDGHTPRLYQRYGWRYHMNHHFWTTFAIRTIQGRKADALELGAGYRIRWSGQSW